MSVEDISAALDRAKIHLKGRRLEPAFAEFSAAEELAKALLDDQGTDAPEVVINAYYISIAISMADVLVQLGRDFEGAVDRYIRVTSYPLAGNPVEPEELWLKLARCSLSQGDAAFRRGNLNTAKQAYSRILENSGGVSRPPESDLYDDLLPIMKQKVIFWIETPPDDIADADARDYPPELLVALSDLRQRLQNLDNGLNYLGYPEDYIPIFSFGRLQDIARSFAQFAAQANREYVNWPALFKWPNGFVRASRFV